MSGTELLEIQGAAERYVAQFEALAAGDGGGESPAWLRERRRAAMDHFAGRGFPSTREEAWRFTDVTPIAERAFRLSDGAVEATVAPEQLAPFLLGGDDRFTAVFVNGRYAERLSCVAGLPEGVRLGGLRQAIERDGELLERRLGEYAAAETNPFTSLNAAFMVDGAFVYVPRDVALDRPLQVLFVASLGSEPAVWHPRNLIVVERGAQCSLLESYVALADGEYWTNVVTEVVVGEGANVDAYRIQRESVAAFHTATTQSCQGRNSVYSMVTFAFGAQLARQDLNAVLDGEGAEATLDGLTLVAGRQHVDHHTTLVHARPHCPSWEVFNGIFAERARGVFNGLILVRPGAQKTDSKQTNNNLLLSRHARADSQPQLEIYADDVKCTHGATLGPIDPRQLFYLQARGLSAEAARALLTYGFAAEILSNVTVPELRDALDRFVRERLQRVARG